MRVKVYYSEIAPELEFIDFDLVSVIKSKSECIVGRAPECDLVLDGLDLSRQHGKFSIKDEYYYFCDLGSSNGSLVNGQLAERHQEYLLNLGDIIRIGDFLLTMEPEQELAATVFKVIDPALFKSRQQQVANIPQAEEQIPPIEPILPIAAVAGLTTGAISTPIIVDKSSEDTPHPVVTEQSPAALVEDEWAEQPPEGTQQQSLEARSASDSVVNEEEEEDIPDRALEEHPASTLAVEEEEDEDIFEPAEEDSASTLVVNDEPTDPPQQSIEEHPASTLAVEEEEDEDDNPGPEKNPQLETTSSIPTNAPVEAVIAGISGISATERRIGAELLSQKQIVLIAHDNKIADLTDLVSQHKDFLEQCLTISWTSIANSLRQQTGLAVSKEIPIGVSGGFQTIAGLVNSGNVLAVIFLKDFFATSQTGQANEEALLRLCNINEILLATNIATAEAIVHYLQS